VGADADLVMFDPKALWTVDPMRLQHRNKLTPYAGRALRGVVGRTLLAGEIVFDADAQAERKPAFPGSPRGKVLDRALATH
jgi:allantoinase